MELPDQAGEAANIFMYFQSSSVFQLFFNKSFWLCFRVKFNIFNSKIVAHLNFGTLDYQHFLLVPFALLCIFVVHNVNNLEHFVNTRYK